MASINGADIQLQARKIVTAVGKRIPIILDAARATTATARRISYSRLASRTPVDRRTVVFECYAARSYACSPRAIYRAMLADEAYRDFEFVWAFRRPITKALKMHGGIPVDLQDYAAGDEAFGDLEEVFGGEALAELRRATLVSYASQQYYEAYARAGTWISNAIIPTHLKTRPGQTYVQCWHGTPLKRLGCDIPAGTTNAMFSVSSIHRRYRAEGRRFTHLLSPSPFTSAKLSTAFDLKALGREDAVIEEGYPRNDFLRTFSAEDAASIKTRLGIPEGKKVILYAPTWRDDQHVAGLGYTFEANVDFDRIRDELGDEWVILFRAHYLIASTFDFAAHGGFVYDVSKVSDINDLYVVSDLLITDYSSVFFDFANLDRPMVFYMYDLEAYAADLRGFYLDLDELPGPVVRTHDELVAAIMAARSGLAPEDAGKYREFRARFTPLDDGHASERVLSRIGLPNGDRADRA